MIFSDMKPKDLKHPFLWEERRPLIEGRVFYVPDYYQEHHLFTFPIFEDPQIFGNTLPVHLEYCSGNGTWIVEKALSHPDTNWIAVERDFERVRKIVSKAHNENLSNLFVISGEAFTFTKHYVRDHSVERIYVNFPDPWPKEKHLDRRLLQSGFFRLLSTRLDEGGELWLTTDHEEYFGFAMQEARATGLYELIEGPPPPDTLDTKYGQRWQAEGIRINHVVFRMKSRDANPHPRRLEVVEVAHARLDGDLGTVTGFEKQVHEIENGHVVLLDCARSLDRERLRLEVIVDEADLRQEILIEVRETPSGIYVELSSFGRPAVTRGVRRAVVLVADWLAGCGLRKIETVG